MKTNSFFRITATLTVVWLMRAAVSCGGGSGKTLSEVARMFMEATLSMDYETIEKCLTKEALESNACRELKTGMETAKNNFSKEEIAATQAILKLMKIEVVGEEIAADGKSATVTVKVSGYGETSENAVSLVKEDGRWKLLPESVSSAGR
jgi:hypothetical protein